MITAVVTTTSLFVPSYAQTTTIPPAEASNHLTGSSSNNSDTSYYDLVITDYRMHGSGISGLDLAKRVKEHNTGRRKRTKVFLMSGSFNESSLPDEFIQALKSEIVDEFIEKPISNDKLIAIVESINKK